MISYRTTLVTFIDILGFEQKLRDASPGEVRDALLLLRESAAPDEELKDHLEMRFVNFSDLVVRTTYVDSKANLARPDGLLWHELRAIGFAQIRLLESRTLIRGGMTVHDLYIDDDVVFGPGLADAYKLESRFAVYPRVVIHPFVWKCYDAAPLLKSYLHEHDEEKSNYIRPIVRKDLDGLWFVDYLSSSFWDNDVEGHVNFLGLHKELILSAQSDLEGLDGRAAKYIWLAHYHNSAVEAHLANVPADWSEKLRGSLLLADETDLIQEV